MWWVDVDARSLALRSQTATQWFVLQRCTTISAGILLQSVSILMESGMAQTNGKEILILSQSQTQRLLLSDIPSISISLSLLREHYSPNIYAYDYHRRNKATILADAQ